MIVEKLQKITAYALLTILLQMGNLHAAVGGDVDTVLNTIISQITNGNPSIEQIRGLLDQCKNAPDFRTAFDNKELILQVIMAYNRYDLCELFFRKYLGGVYQLKNLDSPFLLWYAEEPQPWSPKKIDVLGRIIAKTARTFLIGSEGTQNIFHQILNSQSILAQNKAKLCEKLIQRLGASDVIQNCMKAEVDGKTPLMRALESYPKNADAHELIKVLAGAYVGVSEVQYALDQKNDLLLSYLLEYGHQSDIFQKEDEDDGDEEGEEADEDAQPSFRDIDPFWFYYESEKREKLRKDGAIQGEVPAPTERPLIEIMVGRGYKKSMEALAGKKEAAFGAPIEEMCKTFIKEEDNVKFSNADRLCIIEKALQSLASMGADGKAKARKLAGELLNMPSPHGELNRHNTLLNNALLNQIIIQKNGELGELDIDDDGVKLIELLLKNGASMDQKDIAETRAYTYKVEKSSGIGDFEERPVPAKPLGRGRNFMHKLAEVMVRLSSSCQKKVAETVAGFVSSEVLNAQETGCSDTPITLLLEGYVGKPIDHAVVLTLAKNKQIKTSLQNKFKRSAQSLAEKLGNNYTEAIQGRVYTPPQPKLPEIEDDTPPLPPAPPPVDPTPEVTPGMPAWQKALIAGSLGAFIIGGIYSFILHKRKEASHNNNTGDDSLYESDGAETTSTGVHSEPQKEVAVSRVEVAS